MSRCKCNNERAAMKIRTMIILAGILLLFAGCEPKPPVKEQVKPAAVAPQSASQALETDGGDIFQTAGAAVTGEAIPRWISQPVLPCSSTDVNDKSDGYDFYMNRIRVEAKDAVLMQWLNGELEAFEKEIIADKSTIDGFLHTLELTGYSTQDAVRNRSLIFQPCLSGDYFSLLCNENVSTTYHYENGAHTRTWDLKQKKQVSLKDLFTGGADYIESVNSRIRRLLFSTQSEEDLLKRPFDGIDPDYGLFYIGPGMGLGAHYGMAHLEFIFPEDNPYFAFFYTVSIPLNDLRQLLKPETMGESLLKAGKGQSKSEDSPYIYSLPSRIMPDTHLCETEAMETKEGNISRREVTVGQMADGGVMAKINSRLKDFYASHSNQNVKEELKRAADTQSPNPDTAAIRIQPSAQEFGGFLALDWQVYLYPKDYFKQDVPDIEQGFDSLMQSKNMLFDLATGNKLSLSDIVSPAFYKTAYYKANKDKISMDDFRLNFDGTISFCAKDSKMELPYDTRGDAARSFDWEKWKTVGGEKADLKNDK